MVPDIECGKNKIIFHNLDSCLEQEELTFSSVGPPVGNGVEN